MNGSEVQTAMQLAIKQTAMVFTGWITSCLSCTAKSEDESTIYQHAIERKGKCSNLATPHFWGSYNFLV